MSTPTRLPSAQRAPGPITFASTEKVPSASKGSKPVKSTSILDDGKPAPPSALPPGVLPCTFAPGEPLNPVNWSNAKKIRCVVLALVYAALTGLNIGLYSASIPDLRQGMNGNPSQTEMTLGISMWVWAVAILPLVLAPFSEIYGRQWMYPGSIFIYGICHLCQVYPHNLATLLILRFIMGASGAVGNTLVAGTIADLYPPRSRGPIMATFAFLILGCNGIALWLSTVIIVNLGWQWVGWISLIVSMLFGMLYLVALPETRANVLLYRKKLRLEKETGKKYYAIGEEERQADWKKMVTGSLTRPIYFLVTEPIVLSFSMWLAFLWGVMFLLLQSVRLVFAQYGFDRTEQAMTFFPIGIGALIAFVGYAHQEHLYRRDAQRAHARGEKVKPESRLYHAMLGGIGFPVGAIIFAWTGRPSVPWIAPEIGLTIVGCSLLPAYLSIFSYLADVYETYASSALAAQSLARNICVGIYVLFAQPMYRDFPRPAGTDQWMSYAFASTLLAGVGAVLGTVPFILYRYGEGLRSRSKIASQIWASEKAEVQTPDAMASSDVSEDVNLA